MGWGLRGASDFHMLTGGGYPAENVEVNVPGR